MGREPRTYSVWGTIRQAGVGQWIVVARAMAIDLNGPEEILTETFIASSAEEAHRMRLEMVRALCDRLHREGHKISDANAGSD